MFDRILHQNYLNNALKSKQTDLKNLKLVSILICFGILVNIGVYVLLCFTFITFWQGFIIGACTGWLVALLVKVCADIKICKQKILYLKQTIALMENDS